MRPVFTAGEDQEKKKEAIDVFFKNSVEPLFKSLEKQLEDNGTDYIIGNQVIITIRLCVSCCPVLCMDHYPSIDACKYLLSIDISI